MSTRVTRPAFTRMDMWYERLDWYVPSSSVIVEIERVLPLKLRSMRILLGSESAFPLNERRSISESSMISY